jgi:hypothetical protein
VVEVSNKEKSSTFSHCFRYATINYINKHTLYIFWMSLDTEIVERINHLADRWLEFQEWKMKQAGLDEMKEFHHQEIEEKCAKKDLASHPYIEVYENMVTKNLEKRCIRRTFPGSVPDKCEKPCRGYDKFCADYIPTSTFDFSEIQDMLDYRDALSSQYPSSQKR